MTLTLLGEFDATIRYSHSQSEVLLKVKCVKMQSKIFNVPNIQKLITPFFTQMSKIQTISFSQVLNMLHLTLMQER